MQRLQQEAFRDWFVLCLLTDGDVSGVYGLAGIFDPKSVFELHETPTRDVLVAASLPVHADTVHKFKNPCTFSHQPTDEQETCTAVFDSSSNQFPHALSGNCEQLSLHERDQNSSYEHLLHDYSEHDSDQESDLSERSPSNAAEAFSQNQFASVMWSQ